MSLEELWRLFPIQLRPHNPCWNQWYQEEFERLKKTLPESVRIHHIGSTAVPDILAKPIIDILIEAAITDFNRIDSILLRSGYLCMNTEEKRRDFNKGYTEDGFADRVFHLHLREFGDHDEIFFRDLLRARPDIAAQYEVLKISLWKQFEFNRDAYTAGKRDFIRKQSDK